MEDQKEMIGEEEGLRPLVSALTVKSWVTGKQHNKLGLNDGGIVHHMRTQQKAEGKKTYRRWQLYDKKLTEIHTESMNYMIRQADTELNISLGRKLNDYFKSFTLLPKFLLF